MDIKSYENLEEFEGAFNRSFFFESLLHSLLQSICRLYIYIIVQQCTAFISYVYVDIPCLTNCVQCIV